MIAEALINPLIPALKRSDTAREALRQMDDLGLSQLPVVDKEAYQGFLSEEALLSLNDTKASIASLALQGSEAYVLNSQHVYDVFRASARYKTQVVAVLDNDSRYMGSVSTQDLLEAIGNTYSMQHQGGVLVISLYERDYSLSEISRLVESNAAKVLSANTDTEPSDVAKIRLTLKINQTDLSRIIATLERFGYNIVEQYHQTPNQSIDRERLDMLFRFLDI